MDDHPHDHEFVNEAVPTAHPNCAALLQVPLTGHGFSTILQVSLVCHERVQFQVEVCQQVRESEFEERRLRDQESGLGDT